MELGRSSGGSQGILEQRRLGLIGTATLGLSLLFIIFGKIGKEHFERMKMDHIQEIVRSDTMIEFGSDTYLCGSAKPTSRLEFSPFLSFSINWCTRVFIQGGGVHISPHSPRGTKTKALYNIYINEKSFHSCSLEIEIQSKVSQEQNEPLRFLIQS